MLESSSIENYSNTITHDAILGICLLMALICLFYKKYNNTQFIRIFFLNIIGVICFISSGNTGLLMTILPITLLPKGDFDKILKYMFKIFIFMFLIIVLASQIGILSNDSIEVAKYTYIAEGMTLGFGHPNTLAAQITTLVLMYLCIHRYELNSKHLFFAFIVCFITYEITKCRTAFGLGLLTLFLICLRNKRVIKKAILNVTPYVYFFSIILVFICIALYMYLGHDNSLVQYINDGIFNGRIGLAARALSYYPVTLFGIHMDTTILQQYGYFALDNGQVNILISYGIIGFIVYFWLFQKILLNINKNKEFILSVVLISFILWSMYEGSMYYLGKNFALMFLGFNNMTPKTFNNKYWEKNNDT